MQEADQALDHGGDAVEVRRVIAAYGPNNSAPILLTAGVLNRIRRPNHFRYQNPPVRTWDDLSY